ncbi:MAG: M28 family peptidase, partial [Gemmatimonadota bacterium]
EEPLVVRAVVESAFDSEQGSEPWQVMVEAFIRGTEPDLGQDIMLTGHLQEEGFSANDDASGSASVLEVGRALTKLIEEGRLPRPRRNIRLWWVTEIGSQRQYFADHPEAHRAMWVNVNQDMVGANQAQDVMRKQNITRLPAARFHFFNDVVESVVDYMVAANTYELAQAQAGAALYPKPHTAHLGTLHRFNAEMIFFHTSSDHMPFLEAPIGVPGVSFTNMPDRFIHSSDDDLWNIDRTQLGRNAAAVALISYVMANADAEAAPALTANTVGRGIERLGRNSRLAFTWVAQAQDDPEGAYVEALDQIWYAQRREAMALKSLGDIAPAVRGGVERLLQESVRREQQAARDLEVAYRQAHGRRPPRRPGPVGDAEQALAQIRPVVVAGPAEFLTGRREMNGVRGLHGLMGFEVMNAVDGQATGWEIYRYVAAEAREAGAYYYGSVSAEAVLEYLRNAESAGLIALRRD